MARGLILVLAACHGGLAGTWTGSTIVTQQTAGTLALTKSGEVWTATIAGITAKLEDKDGWLRADLGTGEVRFREATHEAYWLQGGGEVNDQVFTMPIALDANLTATITPLPDELRLSVVIDGSTAFLREPNHNFGTFVGPLTVSPELVFTDKAKKVWLRGTRDGETLHLVFEGAGYKLDVHRATPVAAAPTRAPKPGDGWDVASLEQSGLERSSIDQWIGSIRNAVPTSAHSPAIQALLITRHGKLVVDEYFDGFTAETPHDTRSAGKSWTSTLAGILVDRGVLSLAATLDPKPFTLAHVLSMSTGLDCDDHADHNGEDQMQHQKAQPDWHAYMLALPVVHEPGTVDVYCSGAINLTGLYIARALHEWIPAVWVKELATPLGMRHYYLNLQRNEEGYLAGGMYMRPRDFAKLAQVFLDHGRWHGTQLVSDAWVTTATAAHASLNKPDDYGLGWWRTTLAGHAAFYSSGNGGQLSIAIPDLDLVVTIMAGNYSDFGTWKHFLEDDVARYVIAAAR